jgi:hypothetical protein
LAASSASGTPTGGGVATYEPTSKSRHLSCIRI